MIYTRKIGGGEDSGHAALILLEGLGQYDVIVMYDRVLKGDIQSGTAYHSGWLVVS